MNALQKLREVNSSGKYICVGLDSDPLKLPSHLNSLTNPVLEFNKRIINATKESAAAYKLNLAFYESEGLKGLQNLEQTLQFIPDDVLTIADGKRGDIGNTSAMYAKSVYDHFKFDSTTLHPYMGKDSLEPFLKYSEKLNFILCLTSNPGSEDFQKLHLQSGIFLYQKVIEEVHNWNSHSNCGLVFGATNLEELKLNISTIGNLPLLIPGVGAQGGNLEDISKLLLLKSKVPFLINVSRGIIQKSKGKDFAEAAETELNSLNHIISKIIINKS
jgi:orotidine-5'-phosphate decarboxylase